MAEALPVSKTDMASLEGLDTIFTESLSSVSSTVDLGWTLSEAAEAYAVTERTIRRWIKEKRIKAWKVDSKRGPEWRINPGSGVEVQDIQPGSTGSTQDHQTVSLLAQIVKEQADKLEAATYRNGYLEATAQSYENQVRLLPDLEAKAARVKDQEETITQLSSELTALKATWWYRLYAFVSNKK